MATPYDDRLLWWHWQGGVIEQRTIGELAAHVRAVTPNVAGIAVKTSHGREWQGDYDDRVEALAITGPRPIAAWVDELARAGLETHLWCVVQGFDIAAEAERIVEACRVAGVRSMILDVEAGERYFGQHPPGTARALMVRVREAIPAEVHLGLCLFVNNAEPAAIHLEEWLPHVQSLHPMVYHWDFSGGRGEPEPFLDEAFRALALYDKPIVPILGTYADPASGEPVPPAHLVQGAAHAFALGASGVSFFRLGAVPEADAGAQYAAIRQIDPARTRRA